MKKVFINFTNHPMNGWDEKQRKEAEKYGTIIDMPFPDVEADRDETYIEELADKYVKKILEYQPSVVLCQGEFCLCYQMIKKLQERGIKVMAACSRRIVEISGNKKEVIFLFERFRFY